MPWPGAEGGTIDARATHPRHGETMTSLILAVLALFVVQTLMPASIRYLSARDGLAARLRIALGPRDAQPPMPVMGERAARALANMHEALPVFLTLALLHVARGTSAPSATGGATLFLVARTVYVPAYLSGVRGLRSAVWVASWFGLAAMVSALGAPR